MKPFLLVPWSDDQRTRNWWLEVVRLKGVGRSPLSVAREGLLAVGPGEKQQPSVMVHMANC